MAYFWLKTFHIVGVVVWFSGLFYLVRLFVYHQEAAERSPEECRVLQAQFSIMERRLLQIITTPGMIITLGTAGGLLYLIPEYLSQGWMHAKLAFVCALLIYHIACMKLMKRLHRGECTWSAQRFRALNELPTLILISIVMLVVFKSSFPTSVSVWLMVGLVVTMIASIQLYAKKRRQDQERFTHRQHR